MVGEGKVIMSVKELRRIHVLRQTREKKLTQVKAGTMLGLTPRHIRRLLARVAQAGDQGLAHRGRGKPSNRRIPAKVKVNALTLDEKRYGDFGPTLAAEKLVECHGVAISAETMRGWLRGAGLDHFTRRKRPHRAWRERKAHVGELVPLDGSHHDWFEGRGPRCVLMAYIDDASSQVYARFYAYEGTIPAMDSFMRYVRHYGIPLAIYANKHSTYHSPALPTVDEQLAGVKPLSQFGREKITGSGVFSIVLFEDLSNNPPSRSGTELLNPSTPLTLHTFRDLPLTHYPSPFAAHSRKLVRLVCLVYQVFLVYLVR